METIVPEGQSHLGATAYRGISPENSPSPARRGHTGLVVAGSVIAGLVAALLLVLGPFAGAQEDVISGRILLAFASGWALLAVLSLRAMHVVLADEQATVRSAPRLLLTLTGIVRVFSYSPVGTLRKSTDTMDNAFEMTRQTECVREE